MRIAFIMNDIGLCGGTRVVFTHANNLVERGHEVEIIFPLTTPKGCSRLLRRKIGNILRKVGLKKYKSEWFDLKARLTGVTSLSNQTQIPDADVVVATWWKTAYHLLMYGPSKGAKTYFIQHYETWGGPKREVERTYMLGLNNIVISSWLKSKLNAIGAEVSGIVMNGVDLKDFYPDYYTYGHGDSLKILTPYRREKWKGFKDALKAFQIVKNHEKNVELWAFGLGDVLPSYVRHYVNPTNTQLRWLYSDADIFLFPSHHEGFGLPPMEAMACQTPVVTTNVGAVPEYTIPGKTALVTRPKDPLALADNIIRLINDAKLRREIALNGYRHIQKFSWDTATDQLERLFTTYSKH